MTAADHLPFRLNHRPAIDGLRAVSIIAVLILHLNSVWQFPFVILRGGFLGVDMFFVISGFLITSLLVEEDEMRGGISLRAFYVRRALRLLPAVVAAVLFTVLIAVLAGSFTAVGLTPLRLASTLFYFYNWLRAFDDGMWFLTHFWSLSIEEQFYMVWPVALILLMRLRRRSALLIVVGGIAISSLLKAALYWLGTSDMRLYHGSDTRADALLFGCLISLLIYWRGVPSIIVRHHALVGRVAWLTFAILLVVADWRGAGAYYGGFTFAAFVASLVLLHALIGPPLVLSSPLFVWIGKRSYGLYVWHWPVYLLVAAAVPSMMIVPSCLVGTFCFAALSYRYIEKPFLDLKRRRLSTSQPEVTDARVDNAAVATSLAS